MKKAILLFSAVAALGCNIIMPDMSLQTVYAESIRDLEDIDDEDFDYVEIYDDDVVEEAAEEPAEVPAAEPTPAPEPAPAPAPSVPATPNPPHIKDVTPKTADFAFGEEYVFCSALFLAGIAMILFSRKDKRNNK